MGSCGLFNKNDDGDDDDDDDDDDDEDDGGCRKSETCLKRS